MNRFSYRLLRLFILIVLLNPFQIGYAATDPQTLPPQEKAKILLDQLTPEERVGQLFLVTFTGFEASLHTQIYDLILNHHIGGVVLMAGNDNFKAYDQTLSTAQGLARSLQSDEYTASQTVLTQPGTNKSFTPAFIPLFIGIAQDGDGYPYDQILNGLTPLPSDMALGATWQPDLAQKVGNVLGTELSSLGINLLLGPSLDVLDSPHANASGDLGVTSFGGNSFWVGEMGQAFISGVHQGSNGEIAVIAKHFPGLGSADRLPADEVATIPKTLDQLKTNELLPFFAVTGEAPAPESTADGLLTANVHYQNFAATRPLSFDQPALNALLGLPGIANWRANGGLVVSDDLGSRAIRRYYDPSGQRFDGPSVARDALLGGNDLLYLGNFQGNGDPDSYTTVLRTLDFFSKRYREDTNFQQMVDSRVLHILTLKYKLYKGIFTYNQVSPPNDIPNTVGSVFSSRLTFDVSAQAATLIYPSPAELNNTLPSPPGRDDQMVFVTDTRSYTQCTKCKVQNVLDPGEMEAAILRLYSGQVLPQNLASYTFDDLQSMLDAGTGVAQIENSLRQAKWVIFLTLNPSPGLPQTSALTRYLNERQDLLQQKKVIVFSFGAPYYLDSTQISKLTAYYCLFSKSNRSIEAAARLLFQEIHPVGASPVSVPGVGYDLNTALGPNPNQTIQLSLDLPPAAGTLPTITPTPLPAPQYKVGDSIPVRTGIIQDHNGHPVPDTTIVHFIATRSDGSVPQTKDVNSINGIARTAILVNGAGKVEIRAEVGDLKNSKVLQFDILPGIINGTPSPPTPTATITPTSTPTPTDTPTATLEPVIKLPEPRTRTNLAEWFLSLVLTAAIGMGIYWLALMLGQIRWGIRAGLMALIGGMIAYSYLALGMPGTSFLLQTAGTWGVLAATLLGAGAGWGAAMAWRELQKQKPSGSG